MVRLNKRELFARILDAVSQSGASALVRNSRHPFQISVWNEFQAKVLRIFVWNLTLGGPPTVRSSTEYRIQVTGAGRSLVLPEGMDTLLLGWSEDHGVFAAFNTRLHIELGASPSVQIDEKYLLSARQFGFTLGIRSNGEIVPCFAPDQFLNYALNLYNLHDISKESESVEEGLSLSEQITNEPSVTELNLDHVDEPRREIIETTRRWIRQRDFRGRILSAYRNRCAICHLQLNLVEAAHIVPVSVRGSRDSTDNGLCLCVLHHAAYDGGLVGIGPDYHVLLNQEKLNSLRDASLGGGEEKILENVGDIITVPDVVQDRPTRDNLIRGLLARGWSDVE